MELVGRELASVADPPVAVALIDGEHYPPVVADALAGRASRLDVRAALLLGGAEKLRDAPGPATYGVPRLERAGPSREASLASLVDELRPAVVVDLSDEPVLDARARLRLAAVALAAGARYEGADFRLDPPPRAPYPLPSLAVVGTGKRVGKTALSVHLARLGAARLGADRLVVVAMGRGGPAEPELVDPGRSPLGAAQLLRRARAGAHAASDYLEDAVLAGVPTIGCRRCGGGLAGAVGSSNVEAGARLAATRSPALTIFEGSGAAAPPIAADATLLVTAASAPPEEVLGHLGPVRVLRADAVAIVGAERGREREVERLCEGLRALRPGVPLVPTVLRPAPASPVAGRRAAVFTTAGAAAHVAIRAHLEHAHGATVVAVSGALADRSALRAALDGPAVRGADVLLTEIKAAGVDVVADTGDRRGVPVTFLHNAPQAADGTDALDAALLGLIARARGGHDGA